MKLFAFSLLVLLCQTLSFCQNDQITDSSDMNYRHAIQFYIINQVIAGYKYNFSETSAIRIIINATGLFNDKDSKKVESRNSETDSIIRYENREDITTNHYFEINSQYLQQLKLNKVVTFFVGGGVLASYRFNEYQYYTEQYNNVQYGSASYLRTEKTWGFGFCAVAGLECIVFDNICLFTEYEAAVGWQWQKNENSRTYSTYITNDKYKYFNYELKGLKVGVSIYF